MWKKIGLGLMLLFLVIPISIAAEITVEDIAVRDDVVSEGESVLIVAKFKNHGHENKAFSVEGGIVPNAWRGVAFNRQRANARVEDHPAGGCCKENKFMDTKVVELEAGRSVFVEFRVKAPTQNTVEACNNLGSAWDDRFRVLVGAYNQCGQGYIDHDTEPFTVLEEKDEEEEEDDDNEDNGGNFKPEIIDFYVTPKPVISKGSVTFNTIIQSDTQGEVYIGSTYSGYGYSCNLPFDKTYLQERNPQIIQQTAQLPQNFGKGDLRVDVSLWKNCKNSKFPGATCLEEELCTGRLDSDSKTFRVELPSECTSGECCVDNKFSSKDTICEDNANPRYSCENNELYRTYYDTYCPGDSQHCTGQVKRDGPTKTLIESCESGYRCNLGQRKCVKDSISATLQSVTIKKPEVKPGDVLDVKTLTLAESEGKFFVGSSTNLIGNSCNLPWIKQDVLRTGLYGNHIYITIPENTQEGEYEIDVQLFGNCWDGCGTEMCVTDGCCDTKLDSPLLTERFNVLKGDECSTGVCCLDGEFKSTNTRCDVNLGIEYTCPFGPNGGLYSQIKTRYCSGTSASCSGELGSRQSTYVRSCSGKVCSSELGKCVEEETIDETEDTSQGPISVWTSAMFLDETSFRKTRHVTGDLVSIRIDAGAQTSQRLTVPKGFTIMRGDYKNNKINLKRGQNEFIFKIDETVKPGDYTFRFGTDTKEIEVIENAFTVYVTSSDRLYERFSSYPKHEVKDIINNMHQTQRGHIGVVLDLSVYERAGLMPDEPFMSFDTYYEDPINPTMLDNEYSLAVRDLIVEKCSDVCKSVIIVGDDFVVPYYRSNFAVEKKNSFFVNTIDETILTDSVYIPTRKPTFSELDSFVKRLVKIIPPRESTRNLELGVQQLKQKVDAKRPLYIEASKIDKTKMGCDSFDRLGGSNLILIGDSKSNPLLGCLPFIPDVENSISIERNIWNPEHLLLVINTDDPDVLRSVSLLIEHSDDFRTKEASFLLLKEDSAEFLEDCGKLGFVPTIDIAGDVCEGITDCVFEQDWGWCAFDVAFIFVPVVSSKAAKVTTKLTSSGVEIVPFLFKHGDRALKVIDKTKWDPDTFGELIDLEKKGWIDLFMFRRMQAIQTSEVLAKKFGNKEDGLKAIKRGDFGDGARQVADESQHGIVGKKSMTTYREAIASHSLEKGLGFKQTHTEDAILNLKEYPEGVPVGIDLLGKIDGKTAGVSVKTFQQPKTIKDIERDVSKAVGELDEANEKLKELRRTDLTWDQNVLQLVVSEKEVESVIKNIDKSIRINAYPNLKIVVIGVPEYVTKKIN